MKSSLDSLTRRKAKGFIGNSILQNSRIRTWWHIDEAGQGNEVLHSSKIVAGWLKRKRMRYIYLYADTGCCEVMSYGCRWWTSIFRSMIYGGGSLTMHRLPLTDEIKYVLIWNMRWLYTNKELDTGDEVVWRKNGRDHEVQPRKEAVII